MELATLDNIYIPGNPRTIIPREHNFVSLVRIDIGNRDILKENGSILRRKYEANSDDDGVAKQQ